MTDHEGLSNPLLSLTAGLDRAQAWSEGGSVRYLVAELSAEGTAGPRAGETALYLALAIDVSGSMAGEPMEKARHTALKLVETLTSRDRLTIVAFDSTAELLLDARPMDADGRAAARAAIVGLDDRGGTNLFDGWLLAAERVALAMAAASAASPRVVLLSDGHANEGLTAHGEIAGHVRALLQRGVITSMTPGRTVCAQAPTISARRLAGMLTRSVTRSARAARPCRSSPSTISAISCAVPASCRLPPPAPAMAPSSSSS